jgi:hypothetical protein
VAFPKPAQPNLQAGYEVGFCPGEAQGSFQGQDMSFLPRRYLMVGQVDYPAGWLE